MARPTTDRGPRVGSLPLRAVGRLHQHVGPASISLPVPQAPAQAEHEPAEEREHLRILASYGGIYENARLQKRSKKLSTGWWRHPSGQT